MRRESKIASRRLKYASERNWKTELIQARNESIEICQMFSTSKFLSRSHMIIPFSGNYHVPDSIDWCSSSCPSLIDPRPAKRRRRERTIHTRGSGWFAESAGKLSSRLILVANVREKSILLPSVGSLGPAAESSPRTLRNAAASSL